MSSDFEGVVVIDNYDSFTFNIVYYLQELGVKNLEVYKNDCISIDELSKIKFSHLLISPGPRSPKDAGISNRAILEFYRDKKILGVCLGHQCIAYSFGGKISKLQNPYHGKTSKISISKDKIFDGLGDSLEVCRYHSLYVSELGECEPLGYAGDILMALKLKDYDVYGLQFHPESILSNGGKTILKNWLAM